MDDKLIETFDLRVFTPPCEPGADRFAATARLVVDISEVLPYLNATLRGAVYHKAANSLTWKKGGHSIVFNAFEISTSNVEDRQDAEKELQGLVRMINRTWDRRAEITPSHESRQRPTPMAIYQQLPQINCGVCGEATCFNFALKLVVSQTRAFHCAPLLQPEYAKNQRVLEDMGFSFPARMR